MSFPWKIVRKDATPVPRQSRGRYKAPRVRHFEDARADRLLSDFLAGGENANAALRAALPMLVNRSRSLCDNNSYAKKFLRTTVSNVVGAKGIRLQMQVKNKGGGLDKFAGREIEAAFAEWGKKGTATMCGKLSWVDAQKLFIKALARDGEVLVRCVEGRAAGNRFGFALQFLESDHLDINKRGKIGENLVDMGVETNAWDRPVAYHILRNHPGDYNAQGQDWIRLTADELLHAFIVDRPGQKRGIPFLTATMRDLKMLDGYLEAELVSKRAAASKMGFIVDLDGDEYEGDERDEETGEIISDMEAGVLEELPSGKDFRGFDPQHDGKGLLDFLKAILRKVAGAVGTPYATLSGDLTDVNYSSIRSGELAARDEWRDLQQWMIETFNQVVFEKWLAMSLSVGAIPLRLDQINKYLGGVIWQPRGWQWVDPVKDAQANKLRNDMGVKSRTKIAAEEGETFADVVEEIAAENKLMDEAGVRPVQVTDGGQGNGSQQDQDE